MQPCGLRTEPDLPRENRADISEVGEGFQVAVLLPLNVTSL